MKLILLKYKFQVLLLFTSILWIFILDFLLQISHQTYIFPDTYSYLIASENLYKNLTVDIGRPLIIAAINGFPYLFGFDKSSLFSWSFVVNIFSWLATIVLVFEILKTIVKEKFAFWFTLLYVLTIGSTIINFYLLTESVFTFFQVVSMYYFLKYYSSQNFYFLSIAISVLILSVLIKPNAIGILIIAVLFFVKQLFKNCFNRWSMLIYCSCMIVFFHVQMMKNNYGNYTISYIDSFTYYNYLGTRASDLKTGSTFVQCDNERFRYFGTLSLQEQKQEAFKDLKNQLANNKINFLKAYLIDIYTNSFKGCYAIFEFQNKNNKSYFETAKFFFRAVSLLQNSMLTLVGIFLATLTIINYEKIAKFFILNAFLILYFFFVSGISSEQGDRFHLIFYPQIIILVAYFLKKKYKNISI